MSIEVLKPGALTTLQDLGRYGYQRFGVVVGGAMDEWSHQVANELVGNIDDEATLEITLVGPSLRFAQAALIAIAGADLSANVGGHPIPLGRAVTIGAGTQLDFGSRVHGVRAYLAVSGGFGVTPVMDSRSTYVRGGFGGFAGRALRRGDVLPIGSRARTVPHSPKRPTAQPVTLVGGPAVAAGPTHLAGEVVSLRVIAGAQWELFTPETLATFLTSPYQIYPQSDRMGYRLEGPALQRRHDFEMISEGVAFGTVQVPPDGKPIVLMADRQTTGGYPKIACVASVDLPLMAQLAPRQAVRFRTIELQEAQALYQTRARELTELRKLVLDTGVGSWAVEST